MCSELTSPTFGNMKKFRNNYAENLIVVNRQDSLCPHCGHSIAWRHKLETILMLAGIFLAALTGLFMSYWFIVFVLLSIYGND